jgi:hypothetical protein
MAVPALTLTYPADGDVGIPLGSKLVLEFNRGVDLATVKKYVAIYGAATDQVSGPDPGTYMSKTGERPYLFRSPGFKGLVVYDAAGVYVDSTTDEEVTPELNEPADESGLYYRVVLTPHKPLAPEVPFQYQVIGDPDDKGVGIGNRTIWDPVDTIVGTGVLETDGSYTGTITDDLVVQITTTGGVGTAKYKWYWLSLGTNSGKSGRLTHTGFLTLDKGVAVRFSGSDLRINDQWAIRCTPSEKLQLSYKVSFTTTDNEYTTAPVSPSTPAPSSPPSTVIPPAPGLAISDVSLSVVATSPPAGDYNISLFTDRIEIEFSEDLDPDTVTKDTVKLYTLPVDGIYGGRGRKNELAYSLSVDDNVIVIRF